MMKLKSERLLDKKQNFLSEKISFKIMYILLTLSPCIYLIKNYASWCLTQLSVLRFRWLERVLRGREYYNHVWMVKEDGLTMLLSNHFGEVSNTKTFS